MRLSLIDPFDSMNLRLDRTTGRFVNPILGFTAAVRAHNFRNKKERSGNKWRICMHHSPYIFQLYHERGGISLRDAKTSRSRKSFCKTLFNRNTLREPAGETRAGTSGSPRVSGSSFFLNTRLTGWNLRFTSFASYFQYRSEYIRNSLSLVQFI